MYYINLNKAVFLFIHKRFKIRGLRLQNDVLKYLIYFSLIILFKYV